MVSQKTEQPQDTVGHLPLGGGGRGCLLRKKEYELQLYEELLFHYLSMLALIPSERVKVFQILNTTMTRSAVGNESSGKQPKKTIKNILMSEVQKKMME